MSTARPKGKSYLNRAEVTACPVKILGKQSTPVVMLVADLFI